jgi:hypothetical protein
MRKFKTSRLDRKPMNTGIYEVLICRTPIGGCCEMWGADNHEFIADVANDVKGRMPA